jgi:hypothetical protein
MTTTIRYITIDESGNARAMISVDGEPSRAEFNLRGPELDALFAVAVKKAPAGTTKDQRDKARAAARTDRVAVREKQREEANAAAKAARAAAAANAQPTSPPR